MKAACSGPPRVGRTPRMELRAPSARRRGAGACRPPRHSAPARRCRVGPGGCHTRASHRSGRAGCRIRLLGSRVCCAVDKAETDGGTRERVARLQTLKAHPRHPGFVGAAIEPLPPKLVNLVTKAAQCRGVAAYPVVVIELCISNRHHGRKKGGNLEPVTKERRRDGRRRAFLVTRSSVAKSSSRLSGRPFAKVALQ